MTTRACIRGLVLCASLFCAPSLASAATLYIEPGTTELLKGDTMTAEIRLDTDEGECINTIDAVLTYSESIQVVDISRGRSILSLWVEEPTINRDLRTITFAGGIPNGYCGRIPGDPSLTNVIAELMVRAPGFSVGGQDSKTALIEFTTQTRALQNDGMGTEAQLRTFPLSIELVQSVGTTTMDSWRDLVATDQVPPQPFSVELAQDPNAFNGKYFVVFNTTDKQSGIDHYEVYEEPRADLYTFRWGRVDTPWVTVKSPYVLTDQTLNSIIRVRAVDKAGNERITVLIPNDDLRTLSLQTLMTAAVIAGAFLILVGVLVYGFILWRRRRERATLTRVEDINDAPKDV